MQQTKFCFPLIILSAEDNYRGSWPTQVDPIYEDTIIHAQYEEAIPVPTLPTSPGEIMSGGEGEPVEADEPEEGENDTTPAETERTISGVLASTETVTHEYLTQNGKVVRETITTSMDTTTLDFFYDESGRPFAFNYTPEGSTPNTYYYILNLKGDVVQIIDEAGVMQAEYIYSPWGEIISAEGDLAEVNPLRYRGYYYDSETGFYYLQSRYYDPENHRFINADCYASTGQGFIGVNMFVYCLNSPVSCADYTGRDVELVFDEATASVPLGVSTTLTAKVELVLKIPVFDDITVVLGKGTAVESISFAQELPKVGIFNPSASITDNGKKYSADVTINGWNISVDDLSLSVSKSVIPENDHFDIRVTLSLDCDPRIGLGSTAIIAGTVGTYYGLGLGMSGPNTQPLYANGGGMLGEMFRSSSRVFMDR